MQKDIITLERVQRRVTKLVPVIRELTWYTQKDYKNYNYTALSNVDKEETWLRHSRFWMDSKELIRTSSSRLQQ